MFFRFYSPIVIALTYLFGTLVLYFLFDNESMEQENALQLTMFVVAAYGAFGLGYWLAMRRRTANAPAMTMPAMPPPGRRPPMPRPPMPPPSMHRPSAGNARVAAQAPMQRGGRNSRFTRSMFWFSALFTIIDAAFIMRDRLYFDTIWASLLSPGQAYSFRNVTTTTDVSVPMQLYTLFHICTYFFMPIAVLNWKQLSWLEKGIAVAGGIMSVLPDLADGTNAEVVFTIVRLLIYVFAAAMLRSIVQGAGVWRPVIRRALIFGAIGSLWFGVTQFARIQEYNAPVATQQGLLGRVLGADRAEAVRAIVIYPTHGYTGLAQCLKLPFVWTYGAGHSRAVAQYLEQYFQINIFPRHYMWRNQLETGREPQQIWSTAFPWFASDLTFTGTVLLLGLAGYLFASAWYSVIRYRSTIALVLLGHFGIFIMFLPANNQVFQSRPYFWGTWALLICYAFTSWAISSGRRIWAIT